MSKETALVERHRALGATLEDWGGFLMAFSYSSLDVKEQVDAVRERAGLFDVSGLHNIHVRGSDAESVADHLFTRDMNRIYVGRSAYGSVLTEQGTVTDDVIVFHIEDDYCMVVHGTGTTPERLQESAEGKDVSIEPDDDLHNISLQGPRALEVLEPHTPMDLGSLEYFHQQPTTLFGKNVLLSRTGYSGERGYEIFTRSEDAVEIWDQILHHGDSVGVLPCSFDCLDIIRVEAGLFFYPYDMNEGLTPWEAGLGFTVTRDKEGDFRGKEAVLAAEGNESIKQSGIVADYDDVLDEEAKLYQDGREVGTVNSPAYSHRMQRSLAFAHVLPSAAEVGTKLEVRGENVSCDARVESIPFYDPQKKRPRGLA
jgi:aminomethyltransferase